VKLVPPWYWKSSSTPTTIIIPISFHPIHFHAWPLCHCPPPFVTFRNTCLSLYSNVEYHKYCKWAKISTQYVNTKQWGVLWRSPNFACDEKESTMASSWHWWRHWTFCGENLQA
jgi:hypothetical protein